MLSDDDLRATVRFVYEFRVKNGYCPSVSEISEHIGRSLSTTHRRLENLKKIGYITSERGSSRTWSVTKAGIEFVYG